MSGRRIHVNAPGDPFDIFPDGEAPEPRRWGWLGAIIFVPVVSGCLWFVLREVGSVITMYQGVCR